MERAGRDLTSAGVLWFFFFSAVGGYVYHGWRRDTDNQFRDLYPSAGSLRAYMAGLIIGELGAFSTLLAGFLDGQVL